MSTVNNKKKTIGVVLMTYGSPETLDDVPAYLKRIYGGKDPSDEVIKEFQRRYKLIGGSPLIRITQEQAAALENELNNITSSFIFLFVAGMRFSKPFISGAVAEVTP